MMVRKVWYVRKKGTQGVYRRLIRKKETLDRYLALGWKIVSEKEVKEK